MVLDEVLSEADMMKNAQVETSLRRSRAERRIEVSEVSRGGRYLAVGSVFGAIGVSSCCILPLALFSAGVGGAWIGNLAALMPYQWIFVTLTLAMLAGGFYLVYRKPKAACAGDETCARPLPPRLVKTALWTSMVLVAAAIAFPYIAPDLLGI